MESAWVEIDDFRYPIGWIDTASWEARAKRYCELLEDGEILYYPGLPFDMSDSDREFLLAHRTGDSRLHKNISYRPLEDRLGGFASDRPGEVERMHRFMRTYSAQVTEFLAQLLVPYAPYWTLDFSSFRPFEEQGRDLSLHKRNDLLHVDAFPSRPTRGGRILRVFTNINPAQPRIWLTTDRFRVLAERFALQAGLPKFAAQRPSASNPLGRSLMSLKRAVGMRVIDRAPYDEFMLRFHDYLKESGEFQQNCPKIRLEFPPDSTWIVFTDSVPHAALSGQYALEQTYMVPQGALLDPGKSPLRVLEDLCGRPLDGTAASRIPA